MAVLDISRRSTFYKEKRARAYDFPLEAIDRRGGRPARDEVEDASAGGESPDGTGDSQQRLDTIADGGGSVSGDGAEEAAGQAANGADAKQLRDHVQQAIAALEAVQGVVENGRFPTTGG